MLRAAIVSLPVILMADIAAADSVYPQLRKTGTALSDFVPEGWFVREETKGDVDGDDRWDLAAIIERAEAVDHTFGCDGHRNRSSSAPRMLIVLLRSGQGRYRLAVESRSIVRRADEGLVDDPVEWFVISGGYLLLRQTGGSKPHWWYDFLFQYRNGELYLSGYFEEWPYSRSPQFAYYRYLPLEELIEVQVRGPGGEPGCFRCLRGEPCPPSPGCPEHQSRAQAEKTRKPFPTAAPIPIKRAACERVLPFADLD